MTLPDTRIGLSRSRSSSDTRPLPGLDLESVGGLLTLRRYI